MIRHQLHGYWSVFLALCLLILVAGCAIAEQPTPPATIDSSVPLGYPGHPVTNNAEWSPTIQTYNGVDMLLVPTGCFMMGSTTGDADEQPIYAQCFRKPYWIDRFEVTNTQFDTLGGKAELPSNWPDPQRPRTNVRWVEARDFCILRNTRLPTEAEWEFAARGPDGLNYPWGMVFVYDNGIFQPNSDKHTWDVGSRGTGASWVGAQDMVGNVWEWVNTIYDTHRFPYPYISDDGREDPNDNTSQRVIRGGSWYDGTDYWSRAANRGRLGPSIQDFNIGFRCVRDESP
jgi:formylglycine-generating enzyme required for sulfatase activity